MNISVFSRRLFILGAPLALSACAGQDRLSVTPTMSYNKQPESIYDEVKTEPFPVAAIDTTELDPKYLRQRVIYNGRYSPGTIIVDPDARFLYLTEQSGQAIRYGVGVGREGFGWSGNAVIGRKSAWPTWTPPSSMIKRRPELAQYASGMRGGIENPLGARALYLYQGSRDTLYRLHGTNEPESIGQAVSSGCIRMFNQDIIDLHSRVATGVSVVVLSHGKG